MMRSHIELFLWFLSVLVGVCWFFYFIFFLSKRFETFEQWNIIRTSNETQHPQAAHRCCTAFGIDIHFIFKLCVCVFKTWIRLLLLLLSLSFLLSLDICANRERTLYEWREATRAERPMTKHLEFIAKHRYVKKKKRLQEIRKCISGCCCCCCFFLSFHSFLGVVVFLFQIIHKISELNEMHSQARAHIHRNIGAQLKWFVRIIKQKQKHKKQEKKREWGNERDGNRSELERKVDDSVDVRVYYNRITEYLCTQSNTQE